MSANEGIQIFRVEAQELLEQIEQGLLDLAHDPCDKELVATVFRALHTLKGSGAMFGFDALAEFTHHCETAFDRVRKDEVPATKELVAAVLNAMDHMRDLAEGRDVATADGEMLLAALEQVVGSAPNATRDDAGDIGSKGNASLKTWHLRFNLAADVLVNGTRPLPMLDELRELGACQINVITDNIPPLNELVPRSCYLGWDVVLTTDKPRSVIEDVFMFVMDDMSLELNELAAPNAAGLDASSQDEAEVANVAALRKAELPVTGGDGKVLQQDALVRVPAMRLDELMDRVGELVIAQSRLKQIAGASIDMNLRSVAEEIEHLASELRDNMMSVRMVPVAQLFSRFRRLIHDLARDTGKEIELVTEGEATELDKTVIERLADPLIHLIRNAADHGLETPQDRLAAGKSAKGRITLSARQAGAEVVITVRDDGRGINRDRVRARAEENGLIVPGATLNDHELLQLIFQPGFSTAAAVTNLSGRGVGMDVVKRTIEGLRGTLELSSPPGGGSTVALRIPLTLAIIDGLLVRVGAERYVIPLSAVEECLELSAAQDQRASGRSLLTIREQLVPFVRLHDIFKAKTPPDQYQKIVVISSAGDRVGLVVDQILGDHQTVIKPLSPFHSEVGSFSGATILGDGSVALILDVGALVAAEAHHNTPTLRAAS
ncbi:chemotaxis protein CheA [Acidocella sp.]|uniref:chemotaxis protein CheA n=1 Tax=Acidocella sp. TaxID=50710 RepID=UPI00261F442D|nr:chemotaxis protein CheA [Acidocella sp.]